MSTPTETQQDHADEQDRRCDECKGRGWIRYNDSPPYGCPACNGTGRVKVEEVAE